MRNNNGGREEGTPPDNFDYEGAYDRFLSHEARLGVPNMKKQGPPAATTSGGGGDENPPEPEIDYAKEEKDWLEREALLGVPDALLGSVGEGESGGDGTAVELSNKPPPATTTCGGGGEKEVERVDPPDREIDYEKEYKDWLEHESLLGVPDAKLRPGAQLSGVGVGDDDEGGEQGGSSGHHDRGPHMDPSEMMLMPSLPGEGMDEPPEKVSPTDILVVDGACNQYYLGVHETQGYGIEFIYRPITPLESCSGFYSGGDPKHTIGSIPSDWWHELVACIKSSEYDRQSWRRKGDTMVTRMPGEPYGGVDGPLPLYLRGSDADALLKLLEKIRAY